MDMLQSIPEFFKNKEIFITGASGFIGKAVLEILLRTCDVKTIYLLLREKRGVPVQSRLRQILENPLFDIVRQKNPEAFDKVKALPGDVSELRLGLSEQDRERLRSVQVVFHVAASVRFDDSLTKATLLNTRGTREVMELMLDVMDHLQVGVHVSTTYCNTDKRVVEERVYRDHGCWREAIRLAESVGEKDEYKLACLTEKVLGKLKNTYTYSKHLAENIVEDYSDRLPLVLYRPGIVTSTWKDPIPGWNDNFYGPIGFSIAVGKGIMRSNFTGTTLLQDYMPVDMVVKGMIIATWSKVTYDKKGDAPKLPVYNCSVLGKLHQSHNDWRKTGLRVLKEHPFRQALWYPHMNTCTNETSFRIDYTLKHALPGVLLDTALKVSGNKPMFLKMFKRIFVGMMTIAYFLTRSWDFKSDNMWGLVHKLKPEDRELFSYSFDGYDLEDYLIKAFIGSRKYLLKETEDKAEDMRVFRRNAMIYHVLWYSVYAVAGFLFMYNVMKSRFLNAALDHVTTVI